MNIRYELKRPKLWIRIGDELLFWSAILAALAIAYVLSLVYKDKAYENQYSA